MQNMAADELRTERADSHAHECVLRELGLLYRPEDDGLN